MSVVDKVEKVALFIQQKYPTLEFGSIGVSHEAISDICHVMFKRGNCKKAKKNLVNALKNTNSSLRKLLDGKSDNKLDFLKMLKDNDHVKNDFCSYKTEVVNSACKLLKIKCTRENRHNIFQRCQKSFLENEIADSPKELSQIEIFMIGQENELNEGAVVP
ncbi:uncharacterized protein LOC114130164 [Aphis gossypii]|uniref:uncharacterized protein LOC114130164 n=1 Tax=Aphis gossypii TaxID=80765 RepID=UPI00100FFD7E|nr:uncharacterized protein LOC114130164 [Aphis gossypii]